MIDTVLHLATPAKRCPFCRRPNRGIKVAALPKGNGPGYHLAGRCRCGVYVRREGGNEVWVRKLLPGKGCQG